MLSQSSSRSFRPLSLVYAPLAGRGLCSSLLVLLTLGAVQAGAATIDVDGTTCTLDDAVKSINAGSNQGSCSAIGDYGVSDTLNITTSFELPTWSPGQPRTTTAISDKDLIIQGANLTGGDPSTRYIDGGHTGEQSNESGIGILVATGTSSLTVRNITLKNGRGDGGGGAIKMSNGTGTLTITNVIFSGNIADSGAGSSGGSIQFLPSASKALSVNKSFFDSNIATGSGGAIISNANAVLDIQNSTFLANSASNTGGAIRAEGGSPLIKNCTFQFNGAGSVTVGGGGAIYLESGSGAAPTVSYSTFTGNYTPQIGGAIYYKPLAANPVLNLHGNIFMLNTAGNVTGKGANEIYHDKTSGGTISSSYNLLGSSAETFAKAFGLVGALVNTVTYSLGAGDYLATSTLPTTAAANSNRKSIFQVLSTDGLEPPALLNYHGGPTQTIALVRSGNTVDTLLNLTPNPAIDAIPAGSSTPPCQASSTLDQRGYKRANGNLSNYTGYPSGNTRTPDDPTLYNNQACDMGAYEFSAKVTNKNLVYPTTGLVKQGVTQKDLGTYPKSTFGYATYRVTWKNDANSVSLRNVIFKLNALCSYPTNTSTLCNQPAYLLDTDTAVEGGIGSTLSGLKIPNIALNAIWEPSQIFTQDYKVGFTIGTKWRFWIDVYADPASYQLLAASANPDSEQEEQIVGRLLVEVDEQGMSRQISEEEAEDLNDEITLPDSLWFMRLPNPDQVRVYR